MRSCSEHRGRNERKIDFRRSGVGQFTGAASIASCLDGGIEVQGDGDRVSVSRAVRGTSTLDAVWVDILSDGLHIQLALLHVPW